jgi:tetratricopeptide (TPR) repeat protein
MFAKLICANWFVLLVALSAGFAQTPRSPVQDAKSEAAELNRRGSESVQAKQFEQAKALFERAIQLDPKLADAYENLALMLMLEGDDLRAEPVAVQLLALAPDNYNARLVAGVAAINRSHFSRGRDYLALLIPGSSDDPLVITAYAVAFRHIGEKAEGRRFSKRSSSMQVGASDALLAGQIFRQPELRKYAQKWMEANVADGDTAVNPDLLQMLAAAYTQQGRLSDASALYNRVLEIRPHDVNALVELSELERILGLQEKSVSHLYAAKTLAAGDAATLFHFSQVCLRRRLYVDARDALTKVVAQDPFNQHAWYQLGLAHFRVAEPEEAEKNFKTALKLDASDSWSRVGLGAVLMSTGRQEQAAGEFQRILPRDPHNAAALYYLAEIHRTQGEIPLALRELRQAARSAKEDARPWAALGQLQLAQHDLVSARVSLSKALELNPGYAFAHYQMARLLKTEGEQAAAAKELELFSKYHEEENRKGILGLVKEGQWDYAGFLPPN